MIVEHRRDNLPRFRRGVRPTGCDMTPEQRDGPATKSGGEGL
jgi:hypothetical protein